MKLLPWMIAGMSIGAIAHIVTMERAVGETVRSASLDAGAEAIPLTSRKRRPAKPKVKTSVKKRTGKATVAALDDENAPTIKAAARRKRKAPEAKSAD